MPEIPSRNVFPSGLFARLCILQIALFAPLLHAQADPLLTATQELKDHINGVIALDATQIEQHKLTIDAEKNRFAESADTITAVFDLVETYDSVEGPLWIARGEFGDRNTQPNDLDWTIYHVMQYIMDVVYAAPVIAVHEDLMEGFKFGSHAHFPGPCDPPADPAASHTVPINGSFPQSFGRDTQQWTLPARKPTGTYLAPGTLATVTVPPALVGQGYQIRVGAHSWDLSTRRKQVRRLDRATIAYEIDAETIRVGSPYGGGIYIEVPPGADAGVVDVTVTGGVRAPYFSAKSFHQTSLAEWLETERHHPAPWADFQSDKFMMQVPRTWIYNHPDPVKLMADWDTAMDAINDLMGFPRLRGKETVYPQVDLIMRSTVHAPGYPSVNNTDNPNNDNYGGYRSHYLVRGPAINATAAHIEFHEQGHAYFFPKFGGETEANVNLLHVAALHRMFGYDLDSAFRGSLGIGNPGRTLDNTAVTWMTSFNFSPREQPMASGEKSYQLKGHAKFVDIARLFGWEVLGDYWRSFMEDQANGIATSTATDALLLRLCRNVGRDIRPLFHFWGIHPQNNASLATTLAAENILPSPEIYDLLHHYKTLVPADNAAFQTFGIAWWDKPAPSPSAQWTETEHARQWDDNDYFTAYDRTQQRADITNNEKYIEACAQQVRDRVQELIDLYYPGGDPDPAFTPIPYPNSMGFSQAPAAGGPGEIAMTALSATAIHQPVEYLFENTTAGTASGWRSERSWTESGLTPSQSYTYRVKARDSLGNETDWSPVAMAETSDQFPAPKIVSLSPVVGANVLDLSASFTVTFDLPVAADSGSVTIRNLTDDSETAIDIDDASQVSFSGSTVTIQPAGNLTFGKNYAVRISPSAVISLDGVHFAGLNDDNGWNFTTSNLTGQLGILNLAANGGLNPATGNPWQPGDTYRLAFVTSTDSYPASTDIQTYNAEVQALAQASPLNLGGATWKIIGSTSTVNARDNTSTNPAVNGPGHAVFLLDGSTIVAADYAELWSGTIRHPINLMENGQPFDRTPWPYTGTRTDGSKRSGSGSDRNPLGAGGEIGQGTLTNNTHWVWRTNTSSTSLLPYYALSDPLTITELETETPPSLVSIDDNVSGGPVMFPTDIGYTVTFDEAMDPATIEAGDFENALSTEISISAVTPTADPAVFSLTVTPLTPGAVQLQIKLGATINDLSGTPLDTSAPLADDTLITIESPPENPYLEWSETFPGFDETDPALDSDGGGLASAIEWALGGDPTDPSDDSLIAPTMDHDSDPDHVIFSFARADLANDDPNTSITVEYGSDLIGWTTAEHDGDNVIITETPGTPTDAVEVKLKRSTIGTGGKLFARLNVVVTP
ncbi:MAG TPA: Ig-like domain-containing protein [Luteolibacter sp.]|nr:Ig-like domain-containing protein [Luteolibacter sp.]